MLLEGTIVEARPNQLYRVQGEDGRIVLASLSTRLRRNTVKVLPGDHVTLELSPYDPTKGRIIKRHP